jgi:alkylated DNA repair dioxygenase AlkB
MSQPSLFDLPVVLPPDMPEGLVYRPGLISPAEEDALVDEIGRLAFTPVVFQGYVANRREVSFGWSYDFNQNQLEAAAPVPDFLLPLRAKAAELAGRPAEEFQQVLVLEYRPGAGMGWHRDKSEFEAIVGLSLMSDCPFLLRRKVGSGWIRARFIAERRSAYLLSGAVRDAWEHSIAPVKAPRYSITFRTFR